MAAKRASGSLKESVSRIQAEQDGADQRQMRESLNEITTRREARKDRAHEVSELGLPGDSY